jgi:DNA repair protein RadA/Sms
MAKTKSKTVFTCQNCGAQRLKWEGRCSDCGGWNTLVEEKIAGDKGRGWAIESESKTVSLASPLADESSAAHAQRLSTGIGELDRVLGGGLVSGSFFLLGGDPGIGKSTLLLQMAGGLAKNGNDLMYISGEESVAQTSLRAKRLGVQAQNITVGAESNLETVLELAKSKKPAVLIVDSIQTIYLPEIKSAPGSVSQVRECAGHLMVLAKQFGISVGLIGHVTKDGSIAGPKVLEHMVDTVLSFEGDLSHQFRLLRVLKNRFGATNELGVFTMDSAGLEEVTNPSELFLEERGENLIGSAVFASMEGTRPLLCEVQALTMPSPMAMPRRTAIGFDQQRLHLLVAVLDKQLDLNLAQSDVFTNVVGGLKLLEPATDMAIAAALISSNQEQALNPRTAFFGEIGLTGEVRAVPFSDIRIKEAAKLGFDQFVLPASNKRHLKNLKEDLKKQIVWVKSVDELAETVLGRSARAPIRHDTSRLDC